MSRAWLWGLGIVIVGLVVWAARDLGQQDTTTETEHIGLGGRARVDPLLAAERFLQRMGFRVHRDRTLLDLPAQDSVVVLFAPRKTFGERRSTALLRWVEQGGHLLVSPAQAMHDPILTEIDVRVSGTTKPPEEDARSSATWTLRLRGHRKLGHYHDVALALDDLAIESFRAPADAGEPVADYAPIVGRGYGAGSCTVIADPTPFTFRHIGEHEHAAILWHLLHVQVTSAAGGAHVTGKSKPPRDVWLVADDDMPSLAELLLRYAWPVLLGLSLALLLWLWRGRSELGPLLPPPVPVRRSLAEQLAATGAFLWRSGAIGQLLAPVRRAAAQRATHGRVGLATLPVDALAMHLQAQPAASLPRRLRLLQQGDLLRRSPTSADAFTTTVRQLEAVHHDR